MVIWFIGISGAGKTTLGNMLNKYFKRNNINSFVIDGDLVRDFYNNDLGYSKKDRISNIKRILLAAYILEKNNIIPIVCNISPFEELRSFARIKFQSYFEVFLNKSIKEAINDDVRNIYKSNLNQSKLVGIDLEFEKPLNPSLIINVDNETVDESFDKILNHLKSMN